MPPTELCSAPKILSAAPCRRSVAVPGAGVCVRHLGTDRERRCHVEVRDRSGDRVTCYAWPLAGAPYCAAHDPREVERRREERAARRTVMARGRELLTRTRPAILRGALEILLVSGCVTLADIETAIWRSRWLMGRNLEE